MRDFFGGPTRSRGFKREKVKALKTKAVDEFRFFRSWVESPLKTGAVSPSGPLLAKRMASFAEPAPGARFVELGPGTGAVTKALFERGISQQNLLSVEYSAEFCALLRKRYPGLTVVQGDAYAIKDLIENGDRAGFVKGKLDGIISSLPLFTRPEGERRHLLTDVLELLKPGAPFIQFSYALVPPVKADPARFSLSKTDWVWKNLPPARVWIYRSVH